jgi:hypothetical protein
MRISVLLAYLLNLLSHGQNGPGGVGTAANNVLWLTANQGVTTSGALVDLWTDRSGNPNHAAFLPGQPTQRPTLVGASVNGYASIQFDGVDDQLLVPDHATLDLNQWDLFMVGAVDVAKNNNVWFAKGTNAQPNYGLWSPTTGSLQMPIYDIFGLLSAPTTVAGLTSPAFSLLEYSNTAVFGIFPSRNVYSQGVNVYTDASLLQLPQVNNQPLRIGNALASTGWNLNGDLAELIFYNNPLNQAQRIIVSNYLSAKYALPHTTGNIYVQDDPANGDHDHDVAGIGRVSPTAQHTDARGSGLVRIYGATGLGNNEFLIWGHQNGLLGTWGSTDHPPTLQGRWFRVWRVSEVNQSGFPVDVGAVTMDFDLTGFTPITATDIRLLVDTDNDGIFADEIPIGPPTAAGGNIYRFSGVTALANGRRFTLGTINYTQTPLPIELIEFTAEAAPPEGIQLRWRTGSEVNNDHFTVERSTDMLEWLSIATVPGAGNSSTERQYATLDRHPVEGVNYYRLQQTDTDGSATWSDVVSVPWADAARPVLFPNPAHQELVVLAPDLMQGSMRVYNACGAEVQVGVSMALDRAHLRTADLQPGVYLLRLDGPGGHSIHSFVVE